MLTVWTPGDAGLEVNTSSATCLTCRRVALCLPHFATVTASRRGLRCAHCGAARWYVYLFEPARIDDGLRHAIEEAGGRVEARNTRRASVSGSGLRGWPGESRAAGPRAHTAADSQRGPTSTSLDDGPRSEGARDRSAPADASRGSRSYGARRLPGDADGDGERRAVESAEQRHAPGGAPESATTADRRVAFTDRGPHRGHERPAPASQERSPDGPARRGSAPGAEMDATRPADREGRMGAAHGARAVNAADVQHDPAPPGAAKPRRSGPPPLPASRVAPTTAPETSAAARSALLLRATPASLARPRPERRAFDLGERLDGPGALPLSFAAEQHPEAGRAERALPLSIAAERHPETRSAERALPLSIAAERHPEAGRRAAHSRRGSFGVDGRRRAGSAGARRQPSDRAERPSPP
ncbi:MAG: hypothetical protein H6705_14080 [Myxococcales bacterium]|nr:hypothetical protein [Myxococcales bacterium]